MDIHEYHAKDIPSRFGVPVPKGGLAWSPEQAACRARSLGTGPWVVKAQVHAARVRRLLALSVIYAAGRGAGGASGRNFVPCCLCA